MIHIQNITLYSIVELEVLTEVREDRALVPMEGCIDQMTMKIRIIMNVLYQPANESCCALIEGYRR